MPTHQPMTPTRAWLPLDSIATGAGVAIALFEACFGYHPDLTSDGERTVRYVDPFGEFADNAPELVFGRQIQHGIAAASVIGGSGVCSEGLYAGVSPKADLVMVRGYPLDEQGRFVQSEPNYIKAFDWLVEHHERYGIRVVTTGMGFPGGDYDIARGALPWPLFSDRQRSEWAVACGLTVVTPAGNSSGALAPHLFISPSVLTIGGVKVVPAEGRPARTAFADYPSFGGSMFGGKFMPDIAAPSVDITVAKISSRQGAEIEKDSFGYTQRTGVSFGGPYVAGVIGQMLEVNTGLTPEDIADILRQTALPIADMPPTFQGCGVIQPEAAVRLARITTGKGKRGLISFETWQDQTFDTPEATLNRLFGHVDSERMEGAMAACHHGDALSRLLTPKQLQQGLDDKNPWIRGALVCTAGRMASAPWAVPLLPPLLKDPDPYVRSASLWALCRRGSADISMIADALRDPDEDVRLRAAREASLIADRRLLPVIIEVMATEVSRVLQFGVLQSAAEKITGEKPTTEKAFDYSTSEGIQAYNQEIARLWAAFMKGVKTTG